MAVRSIVKIDEELCNGCGLCVMPCAEGAIEIVDGKARVVKEELCDGAGFCLAVCPEGALTVEKREAPEFDEDLAVAKMTEKLVAARTVEKLAAAKMAATPPATSAGRQVISQTCFNCGRSEMDAVLFPARSKGESTWVCARCLPQLIHG